MTALAERTTRVAASPTLQVLVEAERLRRLGVDVVDLGAGEAFDAPGFIRMSSATSADRLREGAARIARVVEALDRDERQRPERV